MTDEQRNSKILMVDDEAEFCSLLKEYFEGEKYIVEVAHNGEEGFEKACSFKPDIILLDVRMPKMSGKETIKKVMECCPVPIIIMTTSVNIEEANECLERGACSYIAKPINLENLKGEVEKILKKR